MENNIEEDIAKVNTYIELVLEKDYCNCNELNTILGKHCDGSKNVAYAMQHILSDYKRVLQENEYIHNELDKQQTAINKYTKEIEKAVTKRNELEDENKELKKENEKLKQDRKNNYQMIALSQQGALGYMQGYEDGKNSRRSAIANIVENQQIYIFNKQMETYKKYIEKLQKENEILKEEKAEAWEEWNILEQGSYKTEQRLKSENEKLKALDLRNSKIIANMSTRHFQDREKIRNSIPIQKVKDKIEEYKKDGIIKNQTMPDVGEYIKHFEIKALQELIEEREEKTE